MRNKYLLTYRRHLLTKPRHTDRSSWFGRREPVVVSLRRLRQADDRVARWRTILDEGQQ